MKKSDKNLKQVQDILKDMEKLYEIVGDINKTKINKKIFKSLGYRKIN